MCPTGDQPHCRAPRPTGAGGSAAEASDQLVPLPSGQAAERLRVRDPGLGEDAAGSDRADLRQHQAEIAPPRRPHTGGWVGEDRHRLDLSRGELRLQPRSRRRYLVRLLQRTQTLVARSARNAATGAALSDTARFWSQDGPAVNRRRRATRPLRPATPLPAAQGVFRTLRLLYD